jgi:hypothetical protein
MAPDLVERVRCGPPAPPVECDVCGIPG